MILRGLVKAKATFYLKTDVEGRRQRARKGLDTQVVFAEKYECHRSADSPRVPEPFRVSHAHFVAFI